MTGKFGKFIEARRKALGITLRGLAAELSIAPAFMSDIEKGNRYPPNKEKLYMMASALKLSEEDTNKMFDLAAGERENTVSPDLPEYIMSNDKIRAALRLARDTENSDAVWQKVIDMLEEKEEKTKA
ncbi:helix-turn-helix domain-containing protein [Phascolarctobacterium sp.]|uniref:helix-turn-helix domain-containing protein n=1 Tax=Phascolarctobacterium sp. TaxID=2049039 RepID=UPI003867E80F